jgi:Putative peptidoglycan binding domain
VGQSISITLYGGSGSYYFTSTPSSVVQATINGNSLVLYGANSGSVSISVCSAGGCSSLPVTVTGSISGSSLYFSPNPASVFPGQTATVSIYGSGGYYLLGNQPVGISVVINGATLTVSTGSYFTTGSSVVTICQSGGQCANLTITTNGNYSYGNYSYGNYGNGNGGPIYFAPQSPAISVGQSTSITLSGGSGTYYVSSPSYSTTNVQSSVNGNNLILYGVSPGSTTVGVCSTLGGCGSLYVTVSGMASAYSGYYTAPTVNGPAVDVLLTQLQDLQRQKAESSANLALDQGSGPGQFYSLLTRGVSGSEVNVLQEQLKAEGLYYGPITGYYGVLTSAAVRSYQRNHGLPVTGSVGQATRAALNGNSY